MNDCYSTTYPNATPFQAWRAGFREGVKMCLDRGSRPSLGEFESRIHNRNYDNLCIWQSVGADVDNGFWSIYGSRLGTYKTMLTDWDYNNVQWFDSLAEIWENEVIKTAGGEIDQTKELGDALRIKLGLNIVDLDPDQSKFFKHHYMSQFKNKGIMVRE